MAANFKRRDFFILGALILLATVFALKSDGDTDLFWHMATGRWIRETLSFPRKDMFSFIYRDAPWVNLPWIFQVVTSFLSEHLGDLGVLLLSCVCASASAVLLWLTFLSVRKVEDDARNAVAFVGLTLLMFLIETRWIIRPEVFTALFLSLQLYIVVRKRWLWALPIIQILWVNSHGMFVLGYAVMGVAWLRDPRKLTFPVGAAVLAAFVNPYGLEGALYPFYLRKVSADPVYRMISEGRALFDIGVPTRHLVFWGLWLASLTLSVRPGRRVFGHAYFVLLVFAIFFSTTMIRNLAPSVAMTAPFILAGFAEMVPSIRYRKALISGAAIWTVFVSVALTQDFFTNTREAHFGLNFSSNQMPRQAANFIVRHELGHRIFGTPEIENTLMWVDPRFETYIDTRYAEVVPKDHFVKMFRLFLHPQEIEQEIAKYDLNTAAFTHTTEIYHGAIGYFRASPKWQLVEFDEMMTVFTRKGFHDDLALTPETIDAVVRRQVEELIATGRPKPEQQTRVYNYLIGALSLGRLPLALELVPRLENQSDPRFANLLCSLMSYQVMGLRDLSRAEKAEDVCARAFNSSGDYSFKYNLGMIQLANRKLNDAITVLEDVVKRRPDNAVYRLGLGDALASVTATDRFAEAETQYRRALELNPFQENPYLILANHYARRGRRDDAIKTVQKAQSFVGETPALTSALKALTGLQ